MTSNVIKHSFSQRVTPIHDSVQHYKKPNRLVLGENKKIITLDSVADFQASALAMIQQSRRIIRIMTTDFEPQLYSNEEFVEALAAFVRNSRVSRIQILIADIKPIIKSGHQLLDLSRRLCTTMSIRKLNTDYYHESECYLLADNCGVMCRPDPDVYQGYVCFNNPKEVRLKTQDFTHAWHQSIIDAEIRRLCL